MAAVIRRISMPTTLMDRVIVSPGETPEDQAIRNEDTSENRQAHDRMVERDAVGEVIDQLLSEETKALKYVKKGELGAYWLDCQFLEPIQVAWRLGLDEDTVRKAKHRALKFHPCGDVRGICQGVPNCAHQRGRAEEDLIARRVALKLLNPIHQEVRHDPERG